MGRHFEVRAAAMAKTAAAKTKIYSRYGREIYLAAKSGVADPEMNLTLKRVIAQAKSNQVPSDVINRAIEKAKGGSTDSYDEAVYEGFGPGSSSLIIDCLTDNLNRTLGDIRTCFNKCRSKLGASGSVSFMYDHVGLFVFDYDGDSEKLLEQLIEHDVDVLDFSDDDSVVELRVSPNNFHETRSVLDSIIGEDKEYKACEIAKIAQELVTLSDPEELERFKKLVSMLNELDDVSNVFHNVDLSE